MTPAPVLTTQRLRLRRPEPRDAAAAAAFLQGDRARFMGAWDAEGAKAETQEVFDQWDRLGFGLFAITKGDDVAMGLAGPWRPEGWPEVEIGWNLWHAGDEGQGLAFEAVQAARAWAFKELGLTTAVSYIHRDNVRSARLAERLGAWLAPQAPNPYPPPSRAWRHGTEARA